MNRVLAISLGVALCVLMAACGGQQNAPKGQEAKKADYPKKAVQVVHGFKPGGGSDQLSQLTQPFLEKILKVQFANTYKPGADGAIVWKELAHGTKADGYTLGTLMTPKTQLNSLTADSGYKMEDFVPIANMLYDPGIFVVPADSRFKTFKDVLAYAQQNPGKLKVGNSGTGGNGWYNALMIQKLTTTTWNNIPFEGDGPVIVAAAGGHVDGATTNTGQSLALIKGGKLRALAVYNDKRLESLPDVPTLKELDVNFSAASYRGYLAPKDTPPEVVAILADAMEQVAKDPEFIKLCVKNNLFVAFMKGDEYKKYLDNEYRQLKKVVEENKLRKQ